MTDPGATPSETDSGTSALVRGNPWVQGAATAERPTRWWVALIVGVVMVVFIVGLGNGAEVGDDGSFIRQVFGDGLPGLLLILAVFAWVRFKERRPIRTIGLDGPNMVLRFLVGLAIGAVLFTLAALSMIAAGGIERVDVDGDTVGMSALGIVLAAALTWFFQAASEEVVFRGFMFPPGALQLSAIAAFIGPTVVFALLHSAGEGAGPLPLINVGVFAVAATLIALADRGLLLVMGIHVGWNWFQGNVFGIPVSGETPNANTLFVLAPVEGESRALSGGGFGMEATIATTIIWVAVAVAAFVVLRQRSRAFQ